MFWSTRAFSRELHRLFLDLQEQSAFLHQIDQLILNSEEGVDVKLKSATQRFAEILRAEGWAIIFPDKSNLPAIFGKERYLSDRRELFLNGIEPEIFRVMNETAEGEKSDCLTVLPQLIDVSLSDDEDGLATVLLIPVAGVTSEPFCYLAFMIAGIPRQMTGLETEEVRRFAIQVSTQLNIMIQRTQEADISRFQSALNAVYFAESNRQDALCIAMDKVAELLPNWEPFKIPNPPIVHLL